MNLQRVGEAVASGGLWGLAKRIGEGLIYASTNATCASQTTPADKWQPSAQCREKTFEIAQDMQPFRGTLSYTEAVNLARVGLGQDLLPAANPFADLPSDPSATPPEV